MAKYTWESIRKDEQKRNELYAVIQAISQGLELQKGEIDPIHDDSGYQIASGRAPRARGILRRMKALSDNGEKNPDFEDCMGNLSSLLSGVKQLQPEKYQKLTEIEGFQDLRESCDAMMPTKNTIGAMALQEREYIHYAKPTDAFGGPMKLMSLGGFLTISELTEGAEDWRSVPVSEEEYLEKKAEYSSMFAQYGTDFNLLDDIEFIKSLSAPGKVTSVPQKCYQLFYDNFQRARETFPEENRLAALNKHEDTRKPAFTHFMTMRALEGEVKPDGNIKAVKDSMLKYEAAFDEIGLDFMASMPHEKLDALLARDSSDKTVEKEVRKFVANLDKIPKGLPKDVQPSAKERIEALQQKLKAEKDMAAKMRLTAEIIATREMAGAQRGGKGLENHPDPAAVEARTAKLAAEMSEVRKSDPEAMDKVIAQATSGHGGKMMEAYNKAAREAAEKPVSYLDYINKLDLENPTSQDVAKLVAATGLFYRQIKGAQAIANPAKIDEIAATINEEPAFQSMMKDPKVIQNAKMGLGLPVMEQLKVTREAVKDAAQIENDMKNPERRLASDKAFFDSLREYGSKDKPFNDVRRWRVQNYLNTYPSCRAEAMEIIAENKLTGLKMPKIREVPDALLINPEKNKAALQKQLGQEKKSEVKQTNQEKGADIGGR